MKPRLQRLAGLLLLATAANSAGSAQTLPWADLVQLDQLPRVRAGHQVLLRSSYCPDGCRFDRTSEGDTRFLRLDDGEAVIFDEPGAGAIARIWMTMGPGVSAPLDPRIRIRIRLDGESRPRIDLPLARLFRGDVAPFLAPLVADRLVSSGGNVSYVPIPYRKGCVVTLLGAKTKRLWYQITFHRLASADGISSFTGREDLSAWRERLARAGENPWPAAARSEVVTADLEPGVPHGIADYGGPDTLQALRIRVAPSDAAQVGISLRTDGGERVSMSLGDFFASAAEDQVPFRTVLLGTDAQGFLYSFFPMPYRHRWKLELVSLAAAGAPRIPVEVHLERSGAPPAPDSGRFTAILRQADATVIGRDHRLATLDGAGKWVGLAARLSSVETPSREYLEGDERIFLDRSNTPAHYGTGVEDFFNGGFYFDQGPFRQPLSGVARHVPGVWPDGEDTTAMLRLMLSDAVPFQARLRAGLEGGPTGNLAMRSRSVLYAYVSDDPRLSSQDRFVVGDARSRALHLDVPPPDRTCESVTSGFDAEPHETLALTVCRTALGSRFVLRRTTEGGAARLRRRVDASLPGQEADVLVGGVLAGRFPSVPPNPFRRFHETDLDLPSAVAAGSRELRIEVRPRPSRPGQSAGLAEISYELLADPADESID